MEIKEHIENNLKAIEGFKDQITDIGENVEGLDHRVKEIEQRVVGASTGPAAGGFGGGGRDFASRLMETEQFKALRGGQAHSIKFSLNGPMFERKSTTTGSDTTVAPQRLPGVVGGAFQQLRIRDLFPVLPTSSDRIEYTRESGFTNAAAPTAQAATKPETDVTFELGEANIATIAHWLRISRQVFDDNPALAQYLNERLRYGVLLAEEDQFLNGDGTGANISGILTTGNHTDYSRAATGDDYIDTLRKAATQLQLANWRASGIILNPADWEVIELTRDNDDRYQFADPQNAAQPRMWGLPVVPSNSLSEGQFVVADFENAGAVFDRQLVEVRAFEEDADNVTKNLLTVRAEERVGLAVMRPEAVVVGSFA